MNIAELARQLNIPLAELRQILPGAGFDIGLKAIKVDDLIAEKIIENWSSILKELEVKQKAWVKLKSQEIEETSSPPPVIKIPPFITIREFALKLNLPLVEVLKDLMKNGVMLSMNEKIDFETAAIVALDLGIKIELDLGEGTTMLAEQDRVKEILEKEDKSLLQPRPAVVVVMGHVDHGKTKLLDAIRKTNLVDKEAGGITQHIGAYQVRVPSAGKEKRETREITFIDTPGHEAFSAMRSRGAKVADLAILVVAADDGVKLQTIEAYKIIEKTGLPFIVAINKIDKPEADLEKTKKELAEKLNLVPEEWGGKTICVLLSAKAGQGLNDLLEMILLVGDLEKEKIKANPESSAMGTIIESHLDKGEGAVATILVQNGTLLINDILSIEGRFYGKVKSMRTWQGELVNKAWPGQPVRVTGFRLAPQVGDIIEVVPDSKKLDKKVKRIRGEMVGFAVPSKDSDDEKSDIKKLNIILKTDVLGSLEAVLEALGKMESADLKINVLTQGLGPITETDILRAYEDKAWVAGFHVGLTSGALKLMTEKGVAVKSYKVIYELINDIKEKLKELLEPEIVKKVLGYLEVLAIFRQKGGSIILGGKVKEGKLQKDTNILVSRNNESIGQGKLTGLQIGKQEVKEVLAGQECGIKFEGKIKIEVGDILEVFEEEKRERKLEV